jgi:hypothetical protein
MRRIDTSTNALTNLIDAPGGVHSSYDTDRQKPTVTIIARVER